MQLLTKICDSHYKEFRQSFEITNFFDIHPELKEILFNEFPEKKITEEGYVN